MKLFALPQETTRKKQILTPTNTSVLITLTKSHKPLSAVNWSPSSSLTLTVRVCRWYPLTWFIMRESAPTARDIVLSHRDHFHCESRALVFVSATALSLSQSRSLTWLTCVCVCLCACFCFYLSLFCLCVRVWFYEKASVLGKNTN